MIGARPIALIAVFLNRLLSKRTQPLNVTEVFRVLARDFVAELVLGYRHCCHTAPPHYSQIISWEPCQCGQRLPRTPNRRVYQQVSLMFLSAGPWYILLT